MASLSSATRPIFCLEIVSVFFCYNLCAHVNTNLHEHGVMQSISSPCCENKSCPKERARVHAQSTYEGRLGTGKRQDSQKRDMAHSYMCHDSIAYAAWLKYVSSKRGDWKEVFGYVIKPLNEYIVLSVCWSHHLL